MALKSFSCASAELEYPSILGFAGEVMMSWFMLEVFFCLPLAIGLSETFPVCFWTLQIRLVLSLSGVWRVLQEAEGSQRVVTTSCTCGRKVCRRKQGKCKRVRTRVRASVCVCVSVRVRVSRGTE